MSDKLKVWAKEMVAYLDTEPRKVIDGKKVGLPGEGGAHNVRQDILDEALALPAFAGAEWEGLRTRDRAGLNVYLVHGVSLRAMCGVILGEKGGK